MTFYLPHLSTGGVGKMRAHLAQEMTRRGLRVEFLLVGRRSPYLALLPDQVAVRAIATTHPTGSVPGLVRYLLAAQPRYLVTDRLRPSIGVLRARALTGSRVTLLTSVHLAPSARLTQLSPRKRAHEVRRMRRYYPRHEGVICVSDGVRDDLLGLTEVAPERIVTVYNPVVTERMLAQAAQPVEHPFFADSSVPVLVAAGRFVPQKDFPTLLQAMARLRATRPCRLVLLGEGGERPALERLIADLGLGESVSLPGFVDNPYGYMARAAAFVLSSRREGFGNVLAEALALGVPVASTDCPHGPREILQGGRVGELAAAGDPADLARAMEAALTRSWDRAALRAAGRRFTLEVACDGYLRAMEAASGDPGSPSPGGGG